MIIVNEKQYAEERLEKNDIGENPYTTLVILSKYYYHKCGYRKKKIAALLFEFLQKTYLTDSMNVSSWQDTIDKLASRAKNQQLYEIAGVRITNAEMEIIEDLEDEKLQRLLFTMLCIAKLNNIKNPNNNGWVNTDAKDIFEYARITCRAAKRDDYIGQLWEMGLLEFPKRIDNLNVRVTFINDKDTNEAMFISDFRELGYEYLLHNGENYIRCAECGILVKGNKNRTKRYCRNCIAYTPQKVKTIICVDCGCKFTVNAYNTKSCRCAECQKLEGKEKARLRKQKQRRGMSRQPSNDDD